MEDIDYHNISLSGENKYPVIGYSDSPPPRRPVEAKEGVLYQTGTGGNALTRAVSLTQIEVLDLISEGEIEGLVTGEYYFSGFVGEVGYRTATFSGYQIAPGTNARWLRSIYWNEVPVVDITNRFNFQSVNIKTTNGNPLGGQVDNLKTDLTISRPISERLRGPNPGTDPLNFAKFYRILNKECNGAIVNVKVTQLYVQSQDEKTYGDINVDKIVYWIYYRPLFTTGPVKNWTVGKTEVVVGKITQGYIRSTPLSFPSIYVDNPTFLGWEIRIVRVTEDSVVGTRRNQTFVDSLTEIYGTRFAYPNSAIVSAKFSAEYFSQIPGRAFDARWLKVKVPANYNPILKTYATVGDGVTNGGWNGTFATDKKWTDNPAWCFYDLLTNNRYGLGKYIPSDYIDKWTLYKIAQECDTMVPDGYGGVEPKFTCNLSITSKEEAYKVINDMASIFRGLTYYTNGAIYTVQDSLKEKDNFYLFTNANVEDGNFSYSTSSKRNRHTVAIIRYNDKNDFYKPAVEYVEDFDGIRKYGIREIELSAFGCTSKGQAQRFGRWALLSENFETETISFVAGLDGAYIKPGDIIKVVDSNRINQRFGGRVLELGIGEDDSVNYSNLSVVVSGQTINNLTTGYWNNGASIPYGEYTITYVSGVVSYFTPANYGLDLGNPLSGIRISYNDNTSNLKMPLSERLRGSSGYFVPYDNAGKSITFLHTGGKIGMYLLDDPCNDNMFYSGSGNAPTFSLVKNNSSNINVKLDSLLPDFNYNDTYIFSLLTPTYSYDPVLLSGDNTFTSEDYPNIRRNQVQTLYFSGSQASGISGYTHINFRNSFLGATNTLDTGNYTITDYPIWTIERSGTPIVSGGYDYYRVLNIKENDIHKYEINGLEYNEEKFTKIESGLSFENPSNQSKPSAPYNLTFEIRNIGPLSNTKIIDYFFDADPSIPNFKVYSKPSPDFTPVNQLPGDEYLLDVLSNYTRSGSYIPSDNDTYYFRVYSMNEIGTLSSSYASNSITINGINTLLDININSLRLATGSGIDSYGNKTSEITELANPIFTWQIGSDANYIPNDLKYRITIRKPNNSYIPDSTIYYQETGFIPVDDTVPNYKYLISNNITGIRNYDVVIEAMTNNGNSSAGGNFINAPLYDSDYNNPNGYDILTVDNPAFTGIRLMDVERGETINGDKNYKTDQWITPDGNISVYISSGNLGTSDIAGGYLWYGTSDFGNVGEPLGYSIPTSQNKIRFTVDETSQNPFIIPAQFYTSRGYISLALFDGLDYAISGNADFSNNLYKSNVVLVKARGGVIEKVPFIFRSWFELSVKASDVGEVPILTQSTIIRDTNNNPIFQKRSVGISNVTTTIENDNLYFKVDFSTPFSNKNYTIMGGDTFKESHKNEFYLLVGLDKFKFVEQVTNEDLSINNVYSCTFGILYDEII